jgi:protein-S-isoprenylcysteine O-methyltransferase Ste14
MTDLSTFLVSILALLALLALTLWCGARVRREQRLGNRRSTATAAGIYILYLLHLVVTAAAAVHPRWPLPVPPEVGLLLGAALAIVGVALFVAGVASFRSWRRISGMDTTELVTTGIYRWSRNPQNLGWCLLLVGIALMGPSWSALLLAVAFWVGFHLHVSSEEEFLARLFGQRYREYQRRSHRYFGPPRRQAEPAVEPSSCAARDRAAG